MLIQPLNEIRLLISGKQGVFDWGWMIRDGKTASERDFLYGGVQISVKIYLTASDNGDSHEL